MGSGAYRHNGKRQLGGIAGKSSKRKETVLAIPFPLDLCSTEDHGNHLQNEVARERVFTLRPGHTPVKRENGRTLRGWRKSAS